MSAYGLSSFQRYLKNTGYEVVHRLPGRIRVRLDLLRQNPKIAAKLEKLLRRQDGIEAVHANAACASIVIAFAPGVFAPEAWLNQFDPQQLGDDEDYEEPERKRLPGYLHAIHTLTWRLESQYPPKAQFIISSLSTIACWCGAPTILTKLLLSAAIFPMGVRALQLFIDEGRPGSDILDAASCVVLMLHRRYGPASLMTLFVSLGELLRYELTINCQRLFAHQLELGRESVWLIKGFKRTRISIWQLRPGDQIVVYPGELIPVSGLVYGGEGLIVPANPETEFEPLKVHVGDQVQAGSILVDGKLYLKNMQAEMCPLIDPASQRMSRHWLQRNRMHKHALRLAYSLTLPVLAIAALVFAVTGNIQRAMTIVCFDFITGIKIAVPVAVLSSMYNAGQRGIVIRSANALQNLAEVDAIVFARAGALTAVKPRVTGVFACVGYSADQITRLAAGVLQRYNHLAAAAIYSYANINRIPVPERQSSRAIDGKGMLGDVDGHSILVGSTQLARENAIDLAEARDFLAQTHAQGHSRACVAVDGKLAGVIAYFDPLREEASEVIEALRNLGISELAVVSSGGEGAAAYIANQAGIAQYYHRTTPEEQSDIVQAYKKRGLRVAVVGFDTANTLALEQADVAISMGISADITRHRSDIVLTSDDLWGLVDGIKMSRSGMGLARQNILVTSIPNFLGLVLSLMGRGEFLAATLMNNGSVIVAAANGLRPLVTVPVEPEDQPASPPSCAVAPA
jgi:Cu2+-exporting ATPase